MTKYILLFYSAVSLVSLLLYGYDKLCARNRKRRVRESVLLSFTLLGGAVGALLGMNLFSHKTRHWYFWAVALLALILQALLLIWSLGLL